MIIKEAKKNYLNKFGFENTHLKAVLFDMDGILYDSMPIHAISWEKTCNHFSLHMNTIDAYMHEGRTGRDFINILANHSWYRDATPEETKEIYTYKSSTFKTFPPAKKMLGTAEIIKKVKNKGLKVVLVTGSGQQSLLDKLNTSYPDTFKSNLSVTSYDVNHGKPNPEPYLVALKKANIKPWEAVVVENAPLGVKASVEAKIFTIGVNTGPLPKNALSDEGANLTLPSMNKLNAIFYEIYKELI